MKYICEFYIPVENNEERYYAISACDKATYLFSVLNRLGYDVEGKFSIEVQKSEGGSGLIIYT